MQTLNISEAKAFLLSQIENAPLLSETIIEEQIEARRAFLTDDEIVAYRENVQQYIGQRSIHYMVHRPKKDGGIILDLLYCYENDLDGVLEKMQDYTCEVPDGSHIPKFIHPNLK